MAPQQRSIQQPTHEEIEIFKVAQQQAAMQQAQAQVVGELRNISYEIYVRLAVQHIKDNDPSQDGELDELAIRCAKAGLAGLRAFGIDLQYTPPKKKTQIEA